MDATTPSMAIVWPDAPGGEAEPLACACPNCGAGGEKARVLAVAFETPDHPMRRVSLLHCPACDARFYDDLTVPNYDATEVMGWGWHDFYIQQGAGLWSIVNPLARVRKPAGSRFLDVGCAYGFGLDFGIKARGWNGIGVDPSPLAALGARELGVPLRPAYFTEEDADRESYDIIGAAEVIEHVPAPAGLLRLFRRALAPGGVLVMSTPDAACLDRATPEAELLPMLAPGVHMVFQTEASLGRLLAEAGFAHVRVIRQMGGLAAFASASPLDLEHDDAVLREAYRAHLLARAEQTEPGSSLRLGFAARALFEAANDGDGPRADGGWAIVAEESRARFGMDLERTETLPEAFGAMALRDLRHAMPLNLGTALYGRVMRRMALGETRPAVLPMLRLAHEGARLLSACLARLILIDGLTDSIARSAALEIALSLAIAADPAVLGAVAALPAQDPEQRSRLHGAWRALVELHVVKAHDIARSLMVAERMSVPPESLSPAFRWNAYVALTHMALLDTKPVLALAHARHLRAMAAHPRVADELVLAALTLLALDPRFAAEDRAEDTPLPRRLARALANRILPERRRKRAEAAGIEVPEGLEWEVARATAAIQAEAAPFVIFDRLARAHALARAEAGKASAEAGTTPAAVAKLAEIELVAFAQLVNRGCYAEARELAPAVAPRIGAAAAPFEKPVRDAMLTTATLALQPEPDAAAAAAVLARLLDGLGPDTEADFRREAERLHAEARRLLGLPPEAAEAAGAA